MWYVVPIHVNVCYAGKQKNSTRDEANFDKQVAVTYQQNT